MSENEKKTVVLLNASEEDEQTDPVHISLDVNDCIQFECDTQFAIWPDQLKEALKILEVDGLS